MPSVIEPSIAGTSGVGTSGVGRRVSAGLALLALLALLVLAGAMPAAAQPAPVPPADMKIPPAPSPHPDTLRQPGVPIGQTFEFTLDGSKVFPGTRRRIQVYVPAQYRAERPACVYVTLDGFLFDMATVFDNLIQRGEMPVTIAVGVASGEVDSAHPPANPRHDRSNEFDGLNGDLARLILDEVLPAVESRKTPDGLPIRLSRDPNDRATAGVSTGAIAAFTLAWQRPDAFRRVFSGIGTFVGMRGGDGYPVLVRKTEPKPIRVFLQDGSNDHLDAFLGEVGNWWVGNLAMDSALRFAGYAVAHSWDEGGHDPRWSNAAMPDAMRWLWRDWPKPVVAQPGGNVILKGLLPPPEEGWLPVAGFSGAVAAMAAAPDGSLGFTDAVGGRWRIDAEGRAAPLEDAGKGRLLGFDAAGAALVATPRGALQRRGVDGKTRTLATGLMTGPGEAMLVTTAGGRSYLAEASPDGGGRLWLVEADGRRRLADDRLARPGGLALSADGLWLAVAERNTRWGYSYRVAADGTLDARQRFYWFHVPDEAPDSGAAGLAVDVEGRLYAGSRMGVQLFDRNGRSRAILPVPGGAVTAIAFGGARFDRLYAASADGRIYVRRLLVPGWQAWQPPVTLPEFSAG